MLAKTAADNKKAAEQVAAAQADYDEAMAGARGEASAIRDEARTEGRQVIDESRAAASGEVADTLQRRGRRSCRSRRRPPPTQLESSVDGLSSHVGQSHPRRRRARPRRAGAADVDIHRTADRLRRHRVADGEVRRAAGAHHDAEAAGRRARRAGRKRRRRQQKLAERRRGARQGARGRQGRGRQGHRGGAQRLRADRRAARASRPRSTPSASRLRAHSRFSLLRQQTIRELRARPRCRVRAAGRRVWCGRTSPTRPRSRPPWTGSSTNSTRWRRRRAVLAAGATVNLRAASREALAAAGQQVRPGGRRTWTPTG